MKRRALVLGSGGNAAYAWEVAASSVELGCWNPHFAQGGDSWQNALIAIGHIWVLPSWKEDLEPAEMERRGKALFEREHSLV